MSLRMSLTLLTTTPVPAALPLSSVLAAILTVAAPAPAQAAQEESAPQQPASSDLKAQEEAPEDPLPTFLRLREEGDEVRLELAERHFLRKDAEGKQVGPRVVLMAAMHVAEPAFYKAIQSRLNTLDVVLFEGVGPAPLAVDVQGLEDSPARWSIFATRRRMRAAATLLARHREEHGSYPGALNETAPLLDTTPAGFDAYYDAWGRPFRYEHVPAPEAGGDDAFRLGSLGADGLEGGRHAARDLWFHEQRPIGEAERDGRRGLQQDLATALGLVFQLDAMSDVSPRWRNVDANVEQVSSWLEEAEAPLELGTLDGSSFMADAMGRLLRLMGGSETLSGMLRLVGIEVLARSERLLQDPPKAMASTMTVLLEQRNEIVLRELRPMLDPKNRVVAVGILYGAAHQGAFQRFLEQAGYALEGEAWRVTARVDLEDLGLPRTQVDWTRRMLRQQLDKALR